MFKEYFAIFAIFDRHPGWSQACPVITTNDAPKERCDAPTACNCPENCRTRALPVVDRRTAVFEGWWSGVFIEWVLGGIRHRISYPDSSYGITTKSSSTC